MKCSCQHIINYYSSSRRMSRQLVQTQHFSDFPRLVTVWACESDSHRYLASQTNEVKPAASNAIYFPGDNVRIRRLFPREARRVCDRDKMTKQRNEETAERSEETREEEMKRKNDRQRIEFSTHAGRGSK